jgi:hypothetical protein
MTPCAGSGRVLVLTSKVACVRTDSERQRLVRRVTFL